MTFKESIEKFIDIPDWRKFINKNFNRKSGVYNFLKYTETTIHIDKTKYVLPRKVLFLSNFERFRRKSSNKTNIEYKGKKIVVDEKIHIVPFGTYERKFKFSGSFSEILSDILKSPDDVVSKFSENLLDDRNYPLFGIDSTIKYPSYILHLIDISKYSESSISKNDFEEKDSNELNVVLKDVLSMLNINYNLTEVNRSSTFIIFPLPYVKVLENRLDTTDSEEQIVLSIEFNNDFYNVFKSSKIEILYEISESNKKSVEKSSIPIVFTGKSFYEIKIRPKSIEKIGLSSFKILINGIEVNHFSGTYIRGFKINTKIVSK